MAREPFNAISHLVGAVISAVFATFLIVRTGDWTAWVYGIGTVTMFAASSAYHWTTTETHRLRTLDHMAIFLAIAATYTPVSLRLIGGNLGMAMVVAQWALAAIGCTYLILKGPLPLKWRVPLYVSMGWMAVVALPTLLQPENRAALAWVLGGGFAYTSGAVIYALKRPNPWPNSVGFHGIWHLCVITGAAAHGVAVWLSYRLT